MPNFSPFIFYLLNYYFSTILRYCSPRSTIIRRWPLPITMLAPSATICCRWLPPFATIHCCVYRHWPPLSVAASHHCPSFRLASLICHHRLLPFIVIATICHHYCQPPPPAAAIPPQPPSFVISSHHHRLPPFAIVYCCLLN